MQGDTRRHNETQENTRSDKDTQGNTNRHSQPQGATIRTLQEGIVMGVIGILLGVEGWEGGASTQGRVCKR